MLVPTLFFFLVSFVLCTLLGDKDYLHIFMVECFLERESDCFLFLLYICIVHEKYRLHCRMIIRPRTARPCASALGYVFAQLD
jgi:hypothetical protein